MTRRVLKAIWVGGLLAVVVVGLGAQTIRPFTDAQLLRAQRHKTALLQYQLAKQALEIRAKELLQEETLLNTELCGADARFDYGTTTCAKAVSGEKP